MFIFNFFLFYSNWDKLPDDKIDAEDLMGHTLWSRKVMKDSGIDSALQTCLTTSIIVVIMIYMVF